MIISALQGICAKVRARVVLKSSVPALILLALTMLCSQDANAHPFPTRNGWRVLATQNMSLALRPRNCEYRLVFVAAPTGDKYAAGSILALNNWFDDAANSGSVTVGSFLSDQELYRLLTYYGGMLAPLPESASTLDQFKQGGFYSGVWHTAEDSEIRDLQSTLGVRQDKSSAPGLKLRNASLYLTLMIEDPVQTFPGGAHGFSYFKEIAISWEDVVLEEQCR